jgi:hypothetical protein
MTSFADIDYVASGFTALKTGDEQGFRAMAAAVLAYQRAHNPIYARYCKYQKYLPVEAFKRAPVTTFPASETACVFESSGTGRGVPSRHFVRSTSLYERALSTHFESVFGAGPFTLVAHLPHYTERAARSSLVYMVDHLIRCYGDAHSGFFLGDPEPFHRAVRHSREAGTPLLLLGAAFGLLDLVEQGPLRLPEGALVIETGGMKTYRRAVRRAELHRRLAEGFGIEEGRIWSEYGMCELLSQCYTRGGAVFYPPPWMRFAVVDPEDPRIEREEGEPGILALLDLANMYSAAALLTEDRAVQRGAGFEVLGRASRAELRGCNFLLEEAAVGGEG